MQGSNASRETIMSRTDPGFGLRVVSVGVVVTLVLALASAIYAALTWSHPNRDVLMVISAVAALDASTIALLRERLVASGRIEALFAGWNVAHVVVAAVACCVDGGLRSPYVLILFVSVAFASVSLARPYVVAIAALDVAALFAIALISDSWPATVVFLAAALVTVAFVCTAVAGERHARLLAVEEARTEMLRRLARVIEFRDFETGTHIERMSEYCALIATRLGLPPGDVERLRAASAMHDIGKVAVPDSVLLKPGPLTAEERRVVERHTIVGHDILSGSSSAEIELAAQIALTHHEHFDGRGYPNALSGSDIPLAGRIVAVADVFDALTSDRVYRSALPVGEAVEILHAARARQFDPKVLDAFDDALDEILSARDRNQEPGRVAQFRTALAPAPKPAQA